MILNNKKVVVAHNSLKRLTKSGDMRICIWIVEMQPTEQSKKKGSYAYCITTLHKMFNYFLILTCFTAHFLAPTALTLT